MSHKRDRPSDDFATDGEPASKVLKALEEQVSLDFMDLLLGMTPAYKRILIQLGWRDIMALRTVSENHRQMIDKLGTDTFWRALFMADIGQGMWEEFTDEHIEELAQEKYNEFQAKNINRPKQSVWALMYEAVLENQDLWDDKSRYAWIPHYLKPYILMRESCEIYGSSEDDTEFSIPLPKSYTGTMQLDYPYCKKLSDLYDPQTGKNYMISFTSAVMDYDHLRIAKAAQPATQDTRKEKRRYTIDESTRVPQMLIDKDLYYGLTAYDLEGKRPYDSLGLDASLTRRGLVFRSYMNYKRYDFRIFEPLLLFLDTRTAAGREMEHRRWSRGLDQYQLFLENRDVGGGLLDALWVVGSSKASFLVSPQQNKDGCACAYFLGSLKYASSLLVNLELRRTLYKKYSMENRARKKSIQNSEMLSESQDEAPRYFGIGQVQRGENQENVYLVAHEDQPEMGRIVHSNHESFCSHNLPIDVYKKWLDKSPSNAERVCPLCPSAKRP